MKYKKFIFCLIFGFIYGNIVNVYLRKYVYDNNINDFGIADIGNNLVFIPGVISLYYIVMGKFMISKNKDIVFHFIVLSLIEILSSFIPFLGTFDYKDIIGLFIGGVFMYFYLKND